MPIKDFEKLGKKTLRERIYEEVVRLIVSGELPSGGWVDEKQVTDRLRVSRTPFREAIGILAKGGLVEIKPYRGFFVRSFSRNETADLYELYKRLECFAGKANADSGHSRRRLMLSTDIAAVSDRSNRGSSPARRTTGIPGCPRSQGTQPGPLRPPQGTKVVAFEFRS